MSAYLNHLAAMALGEPARGAARPSLPPRYSRHHAGAAGSGAARIEEPLDAPRLPADPAARRRRRADEPAPYTAPAPSAAAPDTAPAPSAAAPDTAPAPSAAAPGARRAAVESAGPDAQDAGAPRRGPQPSRVQGPGPAQPPPTAARVATPSRMLQSPAPLPAPGIAAEPGLPPAPAIALPEGLRFADAGLDAPSASPPHRIEAPPAPAWGARSAPLSDAALAGRTEHPREAEPIVHVTIGRIEVRAPAATLPAAPPPRRPPAEPSLSLSDFLRGGGPGRRQ